MNEIRPTDKRWIDQLTGMFENNQRALEVFRQIFEASKKGKSAYDIKIILSSGQRLAYPTVHRWVKILMEKKAIEGHQVESKKGGKRILYIYTPIGEKAYSSALDLISNKTKAAKRLLEKARGESLHIGGGFGAPDLLKAALELAEKKGVLNRKSTQNKCSKVLLNRSNQESV